MREIPLTQGFVAFVDDADFETLNAYHWHVRIRRGKPMYAARMVYLPSPGPGLYRRTTKMMHREILCLGPTDPEVDHVDGNPLNNQRANLRPATDRQQAHNQRPKGRLSSYKGVQWDGYGQRRLRPWRARIRLPQETLGLGQRVTIGSFASELEAARAYDAAALMYFGEFARLNFPALKQSA